MNPLQTLRRSIFLVSLPFGILHFVLPIYGVEIGASAVEIGLFFTVFSVMLVILRPVVGLGLDRVGRRPFLYAGIGGYAATMFAFAFTSDVWAIMAARILQGTASAFLWLSARTIVADTAQENDRGRSFGSIDQASAQGAIAGTFIGFTVLLSPLGIERGWLPLFIGYGIVTLVALALTASRLPETRPETSPGERQAIVWSRAWVLLLLVTAVTGAAWAMVAPIIMIFLQERLSAGVNELAMAYLPASIIWAVLPARLGSLADRFGRKSLMVLGLFAAAASSFLIPSLASLRGLAALWAFQAACYAAGDPAEQALVADLTGGDQRGRAYGLYTLAAGLGMAVGPLFGGWLYDSVGPQAPFYANGVVLAACGVVLAALLQVPRVAEGGVSAD